MCRSNYTNSEFALKEGRKNFYGISFRMSNIGLRRFQKSPMQMQYKYNVKPIRVVEISDSLSDADFFEDRQNLSFKALWLTNPPRIPNRSSDNDMISS